MVRSPFARKDSLHNSSLDKDSVGLYQQRLMDYYQNQTFVGILENPDGVATVLSPSCGDSLTLQTLINNDIISDVRFQAQGCVIAVATAAMMSEFIKDKQLAMVSCLCADDVKALIQMDLGPVRLRCALLSLQAVQACVKDFIEKR